MDIRPTSVPLMRVAPMFFKERTFWETRLTADEQFREIGSVDHIDYNPNDLDELLVSSLARISVYDSNSLEVKRTFKTSTQYQVYGGCFRRKDGRLVAAGSEEGKVYIFEAHNTNPLRTIELKASTHRSLFMDSRLITFSDDASVRLVDIGSGTIVRTYGESANVNSACFHRDYVRSGCLLDQLIVSGSYDNTVKFWDPRVDELKPVVEFNHGYPVESLCTRGETLLISVGGNKLHVFDMVSGRTLTEIIPRHHKTITSVVNYDDKYLLTGGLDGYLNILDFNYEYVTRFNYDEAQILSLAVNPKLLAVGFNNHHIQVKRFKDFIKKSDSEMAELEKLQSGYFGPNMVTRYSHETISQKAPLVLDDVKSLYEPIVIPTSKRPPKRSYVEKLLATFQHARALEVSLKNHKNEPEKVVYVLHELMKRDKLQRAMTQCPKRVKLMRFISEHLSDTRHNRLLLDSAVIMISLMLSNNESPKDLEFWLALGLLQQSVECELRLIDSCVGTAAQLNTILSQY